MCYSVHSVGSCNNVLCLISAALCFHLDHTNNAGQPSDNRLFNHIIDVIENSAIWSAFDNRLSAWNTLLARLCAIFTLVTPVSKCLKTYLALQLNKIVNLFDSEIIKWPRLDCFFITRFIIIFVYLYVNVCFHLSGRNLINNSVQHTNLFAIVSIWLLNKPQW